MTTELRTRILFDREHRSDTNITGRICIYVYAAGRKSYYYPGIRVLPGEFSDGRIIGRPDADELNSRIDSLLKELSTNYARGIRQHREPQRVLRKLRNQEPAKPAAPVFLDYFLRRMKEKRLSYTTVNSYMRAYRALLRFGRIRTYDDLTTARIAMYDDFIRHEAVRAETYLYDLHKPIKLLCHELFIKDVIKVDPYDHIIIHKGRNKERRPLSLGELRLIESCPVKGRMMERAKDLWIFMVHTGMAYCDAMDFDFSKDVVIGNDGRQYVQKLRQKTECSFYAPLMPAAMAVLEKYHYWLPRMSNQKVNACMKRIARQVGVNKPVTCHVARHTFATLAITSGVSMESVQKMLGHSHITTTQIYAKVMTNVVENDVIKMIF